MWTELVTQIRTNKISTVWGLFSHSFIWVNRNRITSMRPFPESKVVHTIHPLFASLIVTPKYCYGAGLLSNTDNKLRHDVIENSRIEIALNSKLPDLMLSICDYSVKASYHHSFSLLQIRQRNWNFLDVRVFDCYESLRWLIARWKDFLVITA